MNAIKTLQQVRHFARTKYAWPGGYPMVLIMSDGEALCAECTRTEYRQISHSTRHRLRDGWQAEGVDIHYEGDPIPCAHCGCEIESAYGPVDTD